MYTIFVVTFFGFLTFAFADYPKIEKCTDYKPMPNFNSTRFLNGTWYVTNAKHGSNSTVCRRYKTRIEDVLIKLNGDGYYGINDQPVFYEVRCNALAPNSGHQSGKISFTCSQIAIEYGIAINLELSVTVLVTDYDEFAVMYRCVKLYSSESHIEDNLLVLHRNHKNIKDQDSKISDILKQHHECLAHFISRKGLVCPKRKKQKNVKY